MSWFASFYEWVKFFFTAGELSEQVKELAKFQLQHHIDIAEIKKQLEGIRDGLDLRDKNIALTLSAEFKEILHDVETRRRSEISRPPPEILPPPS